MAMGMDLAWQGCRPESTEGATMASPRGATGVEGACGSPSAPRGILGPIPQAICSRCGVGMCPTHTCLRCASEQHADARVSALQAEVDRLRASRQRSLDERRRLQSDLTQSQASAAGLGRLLAERSADNERLRARLQERVSESIDVWNEDYGHISRPMAQCQQCGCGADSPEAIRHVAGTRIGELPCPYLLDMRALGRPVHDDSEEAGNA